MPAADDAANGDLRITLGQLRHDLKTPLTTIHGRAQLLTRGIQRSPSLTEEERTRMLTGLATIEETVRDMVALIDGLGQAAAGEDRKGN